MIVDTKEKSLKKVYRNGNIAWTSSTNIKNPISENKRPMVSKKSIFRNRENRFKDIVHKAAESYGIFENYDPFKGKYGEINSRIDKVNKTSTVNGHAYDSKVKDTFGLKGSLKWTRLCEILLTIVIVTVCVSIVVFQTCQCITKYAFKYFKYVLKSKIFV